jgi:hypothetical protein
MVHENLVFIRFRPVWTYLDGIREFCSFFCQATFADGDLAQRLKTVAHEALENAVKYTTDPTNDEVELYIARSEDEIFLSVVNRTDVEHRTTLKREVQDLMHSDPEHAYINALKRAAKSKNNHARLGLARMRHEGKVELEVFELDHEHIRLTARGEL